MTADKGYVLEPSPGGVSLVVTGPWSNAAARALRRGEADGLVLNYARGFSESNLDLLDSGWSLRRLEVLDRSIVDLGPIELLTSLEDVSIQAAAPAVLDIEMLPNLRSLAGEWTLIGRGLSAVPSLERVVSWLFDDADMHVFRDLVALTALTVKDAPRLESLSGLGSLADLATLTIVGAPHLHEIDDVAGLSSSLRELEFEECSRVDAIDDIESLVDLCFLGVSECGDIASLAPMRSLVQLQTFYGWGSTRILDGDLSPLASLPRLREIRMRNRRGYKPSVGDLAAAVA